MTLDTPYGKVNAKITLYNGETVNQKVEYDDLRRLAAENNMPVKKIASEIDNLLKF